MSEALHCKRIRMQKSVTVLVWLAYLLIFLAAAAAALALAGGLGHRIGLLHFTHAFATLRWSAMLALPLTIIAVLVLVTALFARAPWRAIVSSLGALALAMAILVPAYLFQAQARAVPPIHDISTDTEDPPVFIAVRAAREAAPNSPDYPGAAVARQQKEAYPDIRPVQLNLPPDQAFARALASAERMGWQVVAADAQERRIEAVATTFFYGFKDDVVIRVRDRGPEQSMIDVRSASRVGRGDAGANARRIRQFLALL
jgi:uncharacterized protein (DUF1499 family)